MVATRPRNKGRETKRLAQRFLSFYVVFSRKRTTTICRISGHVQRALRPLRTGLPAAYGPHVWGGELKSSRLPNEIVTYSRARARALGRSGRVQTTKRLFPIKSPQPPLHTHPDLLLAPPFPVKT